MGGGGVGMDVNSDDVSGDSDGVQYDRSSSLKVSLSVTSTTTSLDMRHSGGGYPEFVDREGDDEEKIDDNASGGHG
jgi:hypothetical protein